MTNKLNGAAVPGKYISRSEAIRYSGTTGRLIATGKEKPTQANVSGPATLRYRDAISGQLQSSEKAAK